MPKTCSFLGCKNSSLKNPDLKFAPFVKPHIDLNRCKRWIQLCKRNVPVDKIKVYTYICSEHFGFNEVLDWKTNLNLEPIPFHRLKKVDQKEVFESVFNANTVPIFENTEERDPLDENDDNWIDLDDGRTLLDLI